jgi:hypothetical protein
MRNANGGSRVPGHPPSTTPVTTYYSNLTPTPHFGALRAKGQKTQTMEICGYKRAITTYVRPTVVACGFIAPAEKLDDPPKRTTYT